jgi:hypothetical protein
LNRERDIHSKREMEREREREREPYETTTEYVRNWLFQQNSMNDEIKLKCASKLRKREG